MKDMSLYENIPQGISPVRIILYDYMHKPRFPIHWHEHMEMHYIIEGNSVARCENDITEVNSGECLIINSNELHESIDGMCRYLCIILPPSFAKNSNIILKRKVCDKKIADLAKQIINEYKTGDKSSDIAIAGYASLLLTHLYRNHVYKEINEAKYSAYSRKMIMLNSVVKYIHDNYTLDISLVSVAEKFHVNQYHLCHIFKEFTGKTLKEYLNEARIQKARELLETTDISISEIAFMCGFNDSNYFSRKFRQITGKPPREFRLS